MLSYRWRTAVLAATVLSGAQLPVSAGFFSCFKPKAECSECSTATPQTCRCEECQKPKKRFCCLCQFNDAPIAPVVGGIPAIMVNQAAIVAPTAQSESEQLKQLRDMLAETNQAIRTAKQNAIQQSSAADQATQLKDLETELGELRKAIRNLNQNLGNPSGAKQ